MNHQIKMHCQGCKTTHIVYIDINAPEGVTSMSCNWCPLCEDDADNYFEEWYNYSEPEPEINDPNQLTLF